MDELHEALSHPPVIEVVRRGPYTCQPIDVVVGADGTPKLKAYGRAAAIARKSCSPGNFACLTRA